MNEHKQFTIDTHPEDADDLVALNNDIAKLVGLVLEIFGKHSECLLSPVFRETVRDQAKAVERRFVVMRGHLHIDNPGNPLSRKFEIKQ